METLDKVKELFLQNTQGSILECAYLVEKAKRSETDDDEFDKATITTSNLDRHGHQVVTSGIDTSHYLKNAIVLYQHGHDPVFGSLPIAKAEKLEMHRNSIVAMWKWANDELNPKAVQIKNQWREGFLNATSIGFLAKEVEPIDNENKDTWMPDLKITKSELLEFSIVGVPSNRESTRKQFELQLLPFLEKVANSQKQLTAMLTEVKAMLEATQPVDVVLQWRENAKLPNLNEFKTLELKNTYLESKGFLLEEKFDILHKSNVTLDELIEFFSVKPTPIVLNVKNVSGETIPVDYKFSTTEMDELQNLLTAFQN